MRLAAPPAKFRVSTASGSERLLSKSLLATARGTDADRLTLYIFMTGSYYE